VIALPPFTLANLLQYLATGIINGSLYALVAIGFALIINVTGRFHIAFSVTFAASAFVAGQVGISFGLPFAVAALIGMIAGAILGVLIERIVYWPLNRRIGMAALLVIFVASLGVSTVGEATLSLGWLNTPGVAIQGFNLKGIRVGGVSFTNLNLVTVIAAVVVILGLHIVIKQTALGRMIRAVRGNPEMSAAVGIDPKRIYLVVFAIGSAVGGLAAVFSATSALATPDMGTTPILYAITVAFVAGTFASPLAIGLTGLLIGVIESLSTFIVSSIWTQTFVFGALLLYVAARPIAEHFRTVMERRRYRESLALRS
jgi:branched-chain amino acid transport system permease protein